MSDHLGYRIRVLLARMLTDKRVLGPIAAKWDGKLFSSKAENEIAGMACEYYKKYSDAPKKHVRNLFSRWAERQHSDGLVTMVGDLLQAVSDSGKDSEHVSHNVMIDSAEEIFNAVRLENLTEKLQAAVTAKDYACALKDVGEFKRIPLAAASPLEIFRGGPKIMNAVESHAEVLIEWDQEPMRRFFDKSLARGKFVVFLAPVKRGKSFWLQEVAIQAAMNGRNVAFFEVGDQTQTEILNRFIARAANRPVAPEMFRRPTSIELVDVSGSEKKAISHGDMDEVTELIDPGAASQAMRAFGRKYGMDRIKMSVHPSNSIGVDEISQTLQDWEQDGWTPDVCLCDYMDLLKPPPGFGLDGRDRINETWKAARRLTQERDILFVSATQGNADSYEAYRLTMRNFSEDHRKNAHVTAVVGINQTPTEKDDGMYRLNWPLARDLPFGPTTEVHCAACLAVANPCVLSAFA